MHPAPGEMSRCGSKIHQAERGGSTAREPRAVLRPEPSGVHGSKVTRARRADSSVIRETQDARGRHSLVIGPRGGTPMNVYYRIRRSGESIAVADSIAQARTIVKESQSCSGVSFSVSLGSSFSEFLWGQTDLVSLGSDRFSFSGVRPI